jgi:hypothetical protein
MSAVAQVRELVACFDLLADYWMQLEGAWQVW